MNRALSPAEYRLLVEHAPVMIWRANLTARCDYFNDTWLAFTGRSLEQELGDGWVMGVHPEDLERCMAHYLEHFQRREAFEMEYRLRRHDGVFRWIFDRGAPFVDDEGAFAGFIGSCVDVDDRHRAQAEQRQHHQQQLAVAREFERSILGIVGHDIRDPLSTIHLAAARLRQLPDPSGVITKTVGVVARAVTRIQHIVGDLLDLSRVREGAGIFIAPQPADLRALCRQIIDELEGIASGRRISFECETDGAGTWDEHRILQAISNLTSNAVQHARAGSPVRVRLTGGERRVAVEVHNEGTIPSEVLPRLFEPFRTGRNYAQRGDGLGLGLFIANAIARAHGGEIQVHSANNQTTFRLVLPRHVSAPELS